MRDTRQHVNAGSRRRTLQAIAALGLLAFAPGCVAIVTDPIPEAQRPAHNLKVYDAAWSRVERGYFDRDFRGVDWDAARERHRAAARAAEDEDELYAAINTLLAELEDGHTAAIPPSAVAAERQRRHAVIGILYHPDPTTENRMLILDVMPGGPAEEAGVRRGWLLLRVNGAVPTEVLGLGKLTEGQEVTCEFLDLHNEPRALVLTARMLNVEPVRRARVLDGGFVHLRFDEFDTTSARWLREQLNEQESAPGIIVDLRGNSGGDAWALARMLGEFFPKSVEIGHFPGRRGRGFRLKTWRWFGSADITAPVAVLVSGVSASSAEIFARTMQFYGRATIIGEKTIGIVRGSRFATLPDGGHLQVSIRDFVGPDGRPLEGVGVTPDIPVELDVSFDDFRTGRDPALDTAINLLRSQAGDAP